MDSPAGSADPTIDTSTPSIARVYDYLLGGENYYEVDRVASEAMIEAVPETTLLAAANRGFLRRATRFLVGEAGIGQILDIGSGLPTAGNVHEIAQKIDPSVRVVYVDRDPSVLTAGRTLLASDENTTMVQGELRDPAAIVEHPDVRRLLDLDRPFAVLLGGVLMHLEDEVDPDCVVATLRERIPSGGYLMHSGCCDPGEPRAKELNRVFAEYGMGSRCFRPVADQAAYLDHLELVEPGLVPCSEWRPDDEVPEPGNPAHAMVIGGIGRKV